MKKRYILLISALVLISFVLGVLLSRIVRDFPLITFNHEIKIFEVLTFILTLLIGILFPFLIKKWIEDNRSIKSCLADEIKAILLTSLKIKAIIEKASANNNILATDKDEINFIFHEMEMQIASFQDQIAISFKNESQAISNELKKKFHEYKDYLTGGEMMTSTFTIDQKFVRAHVTHYSLFERHLKSLTHKIYHL